MPLRLFHRFFTAFAVPVVIIGLVAFVDRHASKFASSFGRVCSCCLGSKWCSLPLVAHCLGYTFCSSTAAFFFSFLLPFSPC